MPCYDDKDAPFNWLPSSHLVFLIQRKNNVDNL